MLDAVLNRRSIRHYDDRPIEPAVIEELEEAMLRSPSSRNLQPWRFVFVTDREVLRALAHAKASYGEFLGDAALGVVICGNASASDCWIEDCSIAATALMLAAADAGLGTCWIQIRARQDAAGRPAEERVREILGLPGELSVLSIISVGHPAKNKPPRERESLAWEKVQIR